MAERPCGSGHPLATCCGPLHEHAVLPGSAEQLMRSRYSAYALGLYTYLQETWHPDTRPSRLGPDADAQPCWLGLHVDRIHTSRDPARAQVSFIARYQINGQTGELRETSRFVREADHHWYYVDGMDSEQFARYPRKRPCPCGSNYTFKSCCGRDLTSARGN